MNLKTMQGMAIFMICLVLTIPLYSAQSYAAISAYSRSSSGVQNYRAQSDKTTVVAEIDEQGVTAGQVTLLTQTQTPFTTCAFTGGKSVCTYEYTQGDWKPNKYDFAVRYGTQSASNRIVVDTIPPNVTAITLDSRKELFVSYTVEERAYNPLDALLCSSIKTVNYYLGSTLIYSQNLNFTTGTNCDYSSPVINMTAPSTKGLEKEFCIEVIDHVGNRGESCRPVVVDKEPASVSNINLVTSTNQPIKYVSGKTGPLSAKVRFTLAEHNLTSLFVDASEFTIYDAQKQTQRTVQATCSPDTCAGSCVCEAPIVLNLPQGGAPSLRVRVSDVSENTAEVSIPVSVLADNVAPRLTKITSHECGAVQAIGPRNNSVTAIFQEAESGFSARKVYLDLSSALGPQYAKLFPNTCAQAGSQWNCIWKSFGVTSGAAHGSTLAVQLVSPSQDDAGNFVEGSSSGLYYDERAPSYVSHSIFAATHAAFGSQLTDFPTSGGTIELKLVVSDDLPVSATADFSAVSHVASKTVSCTPSGNNTQTCSFGEIGPLYNGPVGGAPIELTLTDCAGNTQAQTITMDISDLDTSLETNFWGYSVGSPMPARVDRQTLKLIPHKIYFPIAVSGSPVNRIVVQDISSCEPKELLGYVAVSLTGQREPDLLNAPSENALHAKITLERGKSPPDAMSLTCTIKTVTKSSSGIISAPEYDNVTFTIPFYNSPLGTVDAALQKKINEVKDSPLVQGKLIGDMTKILETLEKICRVWGLLSTVTTLLSSLASILGWMDYIPYVKAVAEALDGASTAINEAVYGGSAGSIAQFMNKFCKYLSCEELPWGDSNPVSGFLNDVQGGNLAAFGGEETDIRQALGTSDALNPKGSLIMSIASLCIPGIVYNLQKARAIDCSYIYCLKTQVPNGVPPYFCDSQRASQWCKYVWGEIFQLIPFGKFIDSMLDTLKKLISDPIFLIATVVTVVCKNLVDKTAKNICRNIQDVLSLTAAIGDIAAFIDNWGDIWSPPGGDICEEALK